MRRVLLAYDPPDGGVAEHVRGLALGLPECGWQPYVTGPLESIIYPELEAAGVPILKLPFKPSYNHLISDARTFRQLVAVLGRESFDVVHSHNAKAGVLARVAARQSEIPAIYSPHCFPFVAPYSRIRSRIATLIERRCGEVTDEIVCVADEERRKALEYAIVPDDRLRVIHNGCPPCMPGLERDATLDRFVGGRPVAATLCGLRDQKSVHVFIEAAPAILERCPDACLAVIGDGTLKPELEALARKLGLVGDRFGFFPFRGPSARQLASLDLFVLSSSWEAFPIAVLEALACGVPQVATDVGGTSEALLDGETGLLCPPGDAVSLADRVSTLLLDDSLRRRMSGASIRRYEANFRVDTMVELTAGLYDELAGPPA